MIDLRHGNRQENHQKTLNKYFSPTVNGTIDDNFTSMECIIGNHVITPAAANRQGPATNNTQMPNKMLINPSLQLNFQMHMTYEVRIQIQIASLT